MKICSKLAKISLLVIAIVSISFLQAGFDITGNIKNRVGTNLSGIRVHYYDDLGYITYVTSDGSGNYSILNIPSNTYWLQAQDPAGSYFTFWYNNAWGYSDRTTINLVANTANVNFSLYPSVNITGTVRNTSGTAIANVTINAFIKYSGFTWVNQVITNGSGFYRLPLPAGVNLMVRAEPAANYYTTFYNQGYGEDTATTINIASNGTGYDITLNGIVTINGHVQNASGTSLNGVYVRAFFRNASFNYVNEVTTNINGNYTLTVPSSLNLMLKASSTNYVDLFYNQVTDWGSSTTINRPGGTTTSNINFSMFVGRSISGTARDRSSNPTANIHLIALGTDGSTFYGEAYSTINGTYTISNLPDVTNYLVKAESPSGNFFGQFWNDGFGNTDREVVTVNGVDISGIDFSLYRAATVNGFVHTNAGAVMAGVTVSAYQKPSQPFRYVNEVATSINGSFAMALPAGFDMLIKASTANVYYADMFYGQSLYDTGATTVNLSTAEIKDTSITLNQVWRLTGSVTLNPSVSPTGSLVEVFAYNDWTQFYGQATVTGAGTFEITGTGNNVPVMVRFSSGNYVSIVYPTLNNFSNISPVNRVTLNAGALTNLNPVTLNLGGSLSGVITASTGGQVTVNVESLNGVYFTSITANSGSTYTINRIPTGSWLAKAVQVGLIAEYYGETAATSNAFPVSIAAGVTTPNIDISIGPTWSITGKVTNVSGVGIPGALVEVYKYAAGFQWIDAATANAGGVYLINNGYNNTQVFVKFSSANYQDQFYNNKTESYPTADPVTMTVGGLQSNINATLNGVGYVTGNVRDNNNNLLAGVVVKAFLKSGGFVYVGETATTATGSYTLPVPSLTNVMLQASSTNFRTTFYNQAYDWQTATTLNVVLSGTSGNINFTLDKLWTITGNINLQGGVDPVGSLVEVFTYNDWTQFIDSMTVDSTGYYAISGTGNRNVMVRFSRNTYVPVIWPTLNNFSNISIANRVTVVSGNAYGLGTVTLNQAGSITGVITAQGGAGTITVNIEDLNGVYFKEVTADLTTGVYTADNLPTGNWLVKARRSGLVAEYYGETTSTANAISVNITAGGTASGINIRIAAPWFITGSVTVLGSGIPIVGATIEVFVHPAGNPWQYVDSATTNALGLYTVDEGFNTTNVFVRVSANGYVNQFYNNKNLYADLAASDVLQMSPGLVTTNISFVLFQPAFVTGTVTNNTSGALLSGVTISAYRASDNAWMAETNTNGSGVYSLQVIPATALKLMANKKAFTGQLYQGVNDITSWNAAQTLNVVSGGTSSNIYFSLVPLWRIAGRVTLSNGGNPNGCLVSMYEFNNTNNLLLTINANTAGDYQFTSTNALATANVMLIYSLLNFRSQVYLGNEDLANILPTNSIAVSLGLTDETTFNVILTYVNPIDPIPAGKTIKDTIMSGPNPANPEIEPVHIGFIVDTDVQVKVRIYTLGGEKVYENSRSFGPGYGEFVWPGDDLFNDEVPNGVYLAYVEIDTGNEKIKKVVKIAILR